jgi:hypothetical protein
MARTLGGHARSPEQHVTQAGEGRGFASPAGLNTVAKETP